MQLNPFGDSVRRNKPCYCIQSEIQSKIYSLHYGATYNFIVDAEDFFQIRDHFGGKKFKHDDEHEYPFYKESNREISLLRHLYKFECSDTTYCFKDGNTFNLKRDNVECYPKMRTDIVDGYTIIEYIQGHYSTLGQQAYKIKNCLWRIVENGKEYLLMYCENNALCKLCPESYRRIVQFEMTHNNNKKITWYKTSCGFIQGQTPCTKCYYIHQVVTGCFVSRNDFLNTSVVEHIDKNPLNNSFENLRITTKPLPEAKEPSAPKIKHLAHKSIEIMLLEEKAKDAAKVAEKAAAANAVIAAAAAEEKMRSLQAIPSPPVGTIVDYIHGHHATIGKHAFKLKNCMWKMVENEKEILMMHCEVDVFCKICPESYRRILEFETTQNNNKKLTWYMATNGYIQTHTSHTAGEQKCFYIHQIITGCFSNGKGTKTVSVDHIDRNPLNNTFDNLRIATRLEQEQNTKGIMSGTQRERSAKKELPDGMEYTMFKKYVYYNREFYDKEKTREREFFRVEHPKLDTPWSSSKSNKVSIFEKMEEANKVSEDLDNDIYPEEIVATLPKYMSLIEARGKPHLVFEKRVEDKRLNVKMVLPAEYDLEEQICSLRKKIKTKYDMDV